MVADLGGQVDGLIATRPISPSGNVAELYSATGVLSWPHHAIISLLGPGCPAPATTYCVQDPSRICCSAHRLSVNAVATEDGLIETVLGPIDRRNRPISSPFDGYAYPNHESANERRLPPDPVPLFPDPHLLRLMTCFLPTALPACG